VAKAPFTWRILIRRGWLLLLGGIIGISGGWAISRISVSASSAFQVSAIGADQTPYQAGRLALTYAQLLPQEPAVLDAVGRPTRLSEHYVHTHLSMTAQPATNIVFTRFSAGDVHVAFAGLRALTRAFGSATDSAGSKLHATIVPLSEPTEAGGFSHSKAILAGGCAGLLLALCLLLVFERRRPRVDDLRDLARLVPLPVSRVNERTLPGVIESLTRARTPDGIEFITVEPAGARGSQRRRLLAAIPARPDAQPTRKPTDALAVGATPPTSRDADANPTPPGGVRARALLVRRGAPAIAVEEAWQSSLASGYPILTVLLVSRKPPRWRGLGHGLRTA
jgi:hypothetical protein